MDTSPHGNLAGLFDEEPSTRELLAGDHPLLDTFACSIALKRNYPRTFPNPWKKVFPLIPAFVMYSHGDRGHSGFYRVSACYEPEPASSTSALTQTTLRLGVGEFDFVAMPLPLKVSKQTVFYEYSDAFLVFSQAHEQPSPPRGNAAEIIDGEFFFRLFHHTTSENKAAIIGDRFLKASTWNSCGTRHVANSSVYMSDFSQATSARDTLPMLIRQSPSSDVVLCTDDGKRFSGPPVTLPDRPLGDRLSLLVSPSVIQPSPMIRHYPIDGRRPWIELAFPHVYRCACEGIRLTDTVTVDGEPCWIVRKDSAVDIRFDDPICSANGTSTEGLMALIDDRYLPLAGRRDPHVCRGEERRAGV